MRMVTHKRLWSMPLKVDQRKSYLVDLSQKIHRKSVDFPMTGLGFIARMLRIYPLH
jgi:hypothetical protein